jgi:hypothetical protein
MVFLDKLGWPVTTVKGRPILNFIRRCIHTRKIVRQWSYQANRIAELEAQLADREGFVLVPVEPTEAMTKACSDWWGRNDGLHLLGEEHEFYSGLYKVFIAAAQEQSNGS